MRKNLPGKYDKPLTKKEKLKLMEDHYEKPDDICKCGYHKNSCVCAVQEKFEEKKKVEEKKEEKKEVKL